MRPKLDFASRPESPISDFEGLSADPDSPADSSGLSVDSFDDGFERSVAATKIQALVRGKQVRKQVIKPTQLLAKLKETLIQAGLENEVSAEKLSKVLAREILDSKASEFQSNGKRLMMGQGVPYEFRDPLSGSMESIVCPVNMWLSREGNRVTIEIIGNRIGSGTYKSVHASSQLEFELDQGVHEATVHSGVVARFDMPHHMTEEMSGLSNREGIGLIRQKFTPDKIKKFHFAGILQKLDRKDPSGIREAQDERYSKNLSDLFWDKSVSTAQKTNIMSDLASAVRALHGQGIVHGDVKPENALISDSENRKAGYLSDFDTATEVGGKPSGGFTYGYTDALRDRELITDFTDIYALAMTAKQFFGVGKIPYEKEIEAMMYVNYETLSYLREHPKVLGDLRSTDISKRQGAMRKLHKAFPQFRELLNKMVAHREEEAS